MSRLGFGIAIVGTDPANPACNTAEDNIFDVELIHCQLSYHRSVNNTDIGKHNHHVLAAQFPLTKPMTVDRHAASELIIAVI